MTAITNYRPFIVAVLLVGFVMYGLGLLPPIAAVKQAIAAYGPYAFGGIMMAGMVIAFVIAVIWSERMHREEKPVPARRP